MKNNCQMPKGIGVITIILVGLTFISMLTFNQEITITKEECRNETRYENLGEIMAINEKISNIQYYSGNVGCNYIKDITLCVEYENLIKKLEDSKPKLIERVEEVCEQVEVKDFQIEIHYHNYSFNSILNKKDYLEENCICAYGCMKVDNECLESCEVECPICNEYKCGDYFVEIK